ncbi:hypothetical protein JX265_008719 [Neoarthrinium moseri]|uniref:Uncharacterized protein n=1 Tax=Neoarthrinium moseri TaxID=1658444 RepID=A0A9P9WH55_9PEZI|nr:hypothetical protein JX265_008719 [Neoarthrinium moseri]
MAKRTAKSNPPPSAPPPPGTSPPTGIPASALLHFARTHPLAYVLSHPPFVLGLAVVALFLYIVYQQRRHRDELCQIAAQIRQLGKTSDLVATGLEENERRVGSVAQKLEGVGDGLRGLDGLVMGIRDELARRDRGRRSREDRGRGGPPRLETILDTDGNGIYESAVEDVSFLRGR